MNNTHEWSGGTHLNIEFTIRFNSDESKLVVESMGIKIGHWEPVYGFTLNKNVEMEYQHVEKLSKLCANYYVDRDLNRKTTAF